MEEKQTDKRIVKTASRENWQCKKCSFANFGLLTQCEICNLPRDDLSKQQLPPKHPIKEQKEKDRQETKGLVCPTCTFLNAIFRPKCQMCNGVLVQGLQDENQEEDYDEGVRLVVCSCGAQNDQKNRFCGSCGKKINLRKRRTKIFPYKAPRCSKSFCVYCNRAFAGDKLESHQRVCFMKKQTIIDQSKIVYSNQCIFCNCSTEIEGFHDHDQKCIEKKKFYTENKSFQRLTELQSETIIHMHKKYEKSHHASRAPLLEKMKRLGFTAKDLDNLHHYIVFYAPIIIHIHVNMHMQFFVKDTHYRNQFETVKSSGSLSRSARTGWEDRMFDRKHHNAKDFQRVKYGTINFTNDPKGVRACAGYGQSYFMLKQHVRDRCTFTDMDSSSPSATIGTFRFCFHVLNKMSDIELKAAIEGSKAKEVASLGVVGTYKQIQIHGPVEFKKDIERLYINKSEIQASDEHMKQSKQFCAKNDLEYQLFEYQKVSAPSFGGFGIGFGGGFGAPLLMPLPSSSPSLFTFSSVPAAGFSFGKSIKPKKQGQDYI